MHLIIDRSTKSKLPHIGYSLKQPHRGWKNKKQSSKKIQNWKTESNGFIYTTTFKEYLKEYIDELNSLSSNWDENGALAPNITNIENVEEFLLSVAQELATNSKRFLEYPEINACPNGSIDVVWRLDEVYMLINFRNPESSIAHFYYDQYDEKLGRQGGFHLGKPLPSDVYGYLKSLSQL